MQTVTMKKITAITNDKTYKEALFQMGCLYLNLFTKRNNKRLTPVPQKKAMAQILEFLGTESVEAQEEYHHQLKELVCGYEKKHPPLDEKADAVDYLKLRLQQMNLPTVHLTPIIVSTTNIYDVLNRHADIAKPHIRKLHSLLAIPSLVLVKEVRLEPKEKMTA